MTQPRRPRAERVDQGRDAVDRATLDGVFQLAFTDFQFEALGAPRNHDIPANRDPGYYDLGLCGPLRKDYATTTAYCGLFKTPTLRNAATRKVFFHNGVFHSLEELDPFGTGFS